jgi:arginase
VHRSIAVVGAPSNLGSAPYADGESRHVDWAPQVLRGRDIVKRLGAIDLGDVVASPSGLVPRWNSRCERELARYSRALARRVTSAIEHGRFAVVLGGDCSIVLGCLAGARRAVDGSVGLVYVDAHSDFRESVDARTGYAAASFALATGRGSARLVRSLGPGALVADRHAVLLSRRDLEDTSATDRLGRSGVLDLPLERMETIGVEQVGRCALARMAGTAGYFIHVDVDVLDPAVMPAVGSPVSGGLLPDQLVALLAPLVAHHKALGIAFAVYDPALDPDRSSARRLIRIIESACRGSEEISTD